LNEETQDEFVEIDLGELTKKGKLAKAEENFFSKIDDEDIRKKKILNDGLAQDNDLRFDYAEKAYSLVQTWVGFTIVLICCQFGLKRFGFYLEKEEFIAVVISLTGTMFGFWMLVGRYLFPNGGTRPNNSKSPKSKKTKTPT